MEIFDEIRCQEKDAKAAKTVMILNIGSMKKLNHNACYVCQKSAFSTSCEKCRKNICLGCFKKCSGCGRGCCNCCLTTTWTQSQEFFYCIDCLYSQSSSAIC
jgi:hypothetical protein